MTCDNIIVISERYSSAAAISLHNNIITNLYNYSAVLGSGSLQLYHGINTRKIATYLPQTPSKRSLAACTVTPRAGRAPLTVVTFYSVFHSLLRPFDGVPLEYISNVLIMCTSYLCALNRSLFALI